MKKLIKFLIFVLFIACFIYLGSRDYKIDDKKKISTKKTSEVLLKEDTVFKEINHSTLLSKMSSKNANMIVFACFESKACSIYGNMIDNLFKQFSIHDVYYYDFLDDRNNNNATYQKIVDKLSDYLFTDDSGKQQLHAPTLIFISDGNVYGIDDEFSTYRGSLKPEEYLNEERLEEKKNELIELIVGYLNYE